MHKQTNDRNHTTTEPSPTRANRQGGRSSLRRLAALALTAAALTGAARAQSLYWDLNGATAGAGGPAPAGTWDTSTANWSTDSAGSVATGLWTPGSTAIFSAGTDATGGYAITLSGTQTAGGVTFNSGTPSLGSGTLLLNAGAVVSVASGHAAIIGSVIDGPGAWTISSSGTLSLSGANTIAGPLTVTGGKVQFDANTAAGTGAILVTPSTDVFLQSVVAGTVLTNPITLNASRNVDISSLSGTLTLNGSIGGARTLWTIGGQGANTVALGGSNYFNGNVELVSGSLVITQDKALGEISGGTKVDAGATLGIQGNITYTYPENVTVAGDGVGGLGAVRNLGGDNVFFGPLSLQTSVTIGADAGSLELAGTITGAGLDLTKTGAGRLVVSGFGNNFSDTTVAGGELQVGSTLGSGTVTVDAGAVLSGGGTVAGAVALSGAISPAGSPGAITTGAETWNAGASYNWEINDAGNGTAGAGTGLGWDLVNAINGAGTLTINATAVTPFTIHLTSLDPISGAPAPAGDFDNTADYSFVIVHTTGGITGFDPAKFVLDDSGFQNAKGFGKFVLALVNGGNDLALQFVHAPFIVTAPTGATKECGVDSVTFTVAAGGTPDLSYQWSKNGNAINGATGSAYTIPTVSAGDTGDYNAQVSNVYGVTNSASAHLAVQDTQPPSITCPNNVTVAADSGSCFATAVALGTPTASDNCGLATVTNNAPSQFPPGTTTVTWTAVDAAGHLSTCAQTVTVLDSATPPAATFVDAAYSGLPAGTQVTWPNTGGTGPHFIGCDAFASIQGGIDRVAAGGAVSVAAGTYTEQLLVQKSLVLNGAGIDQSVVKAPAGTRNGAPGHTDGPWTSDYLLAAYPAAGTISVKVEGFTFDADGQTHQYDRFTGVLFENVKGESISDAGLFNCRVTGFDPADNSATGVRTLEDSLLTVATNDVSYTINGIATYGDFLAHPSPRVAIVGNTVSLNVATPDGDEQGIVLGFLATGTIDGNMLPSGVNGIVLSYASNCGISNNTLESVTFNSGSQSGIDMGWAITLDNGSTNNLVLNNGIYDCELGIWISNGANTNTFAGNDLSGNQINVQVDTYSGGAAPAGLVFIDNSFDTPNIVPGFINNTANLVDASGNWWADNTLTGVKDALQGSVDFTPWLDVPDNNASDTGFLGDFSILYVAADSPQASAVPRIQEAINLIADGANTGPDREILVVRGDYPGNLLVDRAVILSGPNFGVAGTGARGPEAVVRPTDNDTDFGRVIDVAASGVTIDGFQIDGDGPNGTGRTVGGVDVNASGGIQNGPFIDAPDYFVCQYDIDHLTVRNNVFQNFTWYGLYLGRPIGSTNSYFVVQNNLFRNLPEGAQFYAVQADFSQNVLSNATRVTSMHQVTGAAEPGFVPQITFNTLDVATDASVWDARDGTSSPRDTGIWVNGRNGSAPALAVSANTINVTTIPAGKEYRALSVWGVGGDREVSLSGNVVNGNGAAQVGLYAWNLTSSKPVVLSGGALNNIAQAGVLAVNNDAQWGPADTAITVDGVPVTLAPGAAGIKADGPVTPVNQVRVTVTGNSSINGGAAGVLVAGPNAAASVLANKASLTGNGIGVDVDAGKALLENNTLTNNSIAGIRAQNGAVVDAGDCSGGNVTGLGTGSGLNGSSAGGNNLSGYFGGTGKAIINLNSGTPAVLAYQDAFGASGSQDILGVLTGPVNFSQAGGLVMTCPPSLSGLAYQCFGDIPPAATDLAGFEALGGKASANPATVSASDAIVTNVSGPLTLGYTVTRTYTVTDACGQSQSCQQTITILDTLAPVVTAPQPPATISVGANCQAAIPDLRPQTTAHDNCTADGDIVLAQDPAPGTLAGTGTHTVTLTATDRAGNSSSTQVPVTMADTTPPIVSCPAAIVQGTDPGQTYATVSFTLSATDNCDTAPTVAAVPPAGQFPAGTNVVTVTASDASGNQNTCSFTVAVIALPVITEQPASRTNFVGTPASFTVSATSPAALSYQWKKNNVPLADGGVIQGATTATLTLTSVSDADAGDYAVEVSNLAGTTTSDSAHLAIQTAPVITGQPASRTNNAGTAATFTVTLAAGSTPPFQFIWHKFHTNVLSDGGNISGAATATLTLSNVLAADAGIYSVEVSNAVATVSSDDAQLTVIDPAILVQPADVSVAVGGPASFNVKAAGTGTLEYQWQQDGFDLPGETASTLSIASTVDSDAGAYTVVVSGSLGTVTSDIAMLALTHPPVITVPPASQVANQGDTVIFDVSANGATPFSYQWQKAGADLPGRTTRQLILSGVTTADDGDYRVIVSNTDGAATSPAATLTVIVPPAIAVQPLDQTNNAGATGSFSVTATGGAPAYYWYKNETNLLADGGKISGSTSNVLTLADVLGADDGVYSVLVSNRAGMVLSSNAVLLVVDPIITNQPAGLTVNLGDPASFTVGAYGTAPHYQWRKDGNDLPGATDASYALATVADNDAGDYTVVVTNAFGSVTSAPVATLVVIDPPTVTTPPANLTVNQGQPASFTVGVAGTPPFTYQWRSNGTDIPDATDVTFTIPSASTADEADYSVVVRNAAGTATSASGHLFVIVPTAILTGPVSVTTNASATVTFTVSASGTAPAYQWYKNAVALTDGGNIAGATAATLTLSNVLHADQAAYSVIVSNTASTDTASATLTVIDPAILVQPVSQTNFIGGTATFNVTAAGTAPLSYQWRQNGAPLFGRTQSSLTLTNLSNSDAGDYTVVITNAVGDVTSAIAKLGTASPLITAQPTNLTVALGQPASFSVSVSGQTPFKYQWQKNGVDVPDATNRIFNIASALAGDAATYRVLVSNPTGTETSQPATLTIQFPVTQLRLLSVSEQGPTLTMSGADGYRYAILGSSTVAPANWVPLVTNTAPYQFQDTNHVGQPYLFYRGQFVP